LKRNLFGHFRLFPTLGILGPVLSSVITSNPATCDHFKSGQRSRTQDMKLFYRAGAGSGKYCSVSF
jgi:hypothetical protein